MSVTARIAFVLALIASLSTVHAAETSLRMTSDPGDYVGEEQQYFFTPADGTFYVTAASGNGAAVNFDDGSGSFWFLRFVAPNRVLLTPGDYDGAQQYPFQALS